jgi:hypothetical protein
MKAAVEAIAPQAYPVHRDMPMLMVSDLRVRIDTGALRAWRAVALSINTAGTARAPSLIDIGPS